jgi:activator of HSP90 ATPase
MLDELDYLIGITPVEVLMAEAIEISEMIACPTDKLYHMLLDSEGHSQLTGSAATVGSLIGDSFTAWDGYISGKTIGLQPNRRIIQLWRTTEFPEGSPDSRVEIQLEPEDDDITRVTFKHTNIPDGQGENYKQGWIDYYFTPMKKHFGG